MISFTTAFDLLVYKGIITPYAIKPTYVFLVVLLTSWLIFSSLVYPKTIESPKKKEQFDISKRMKTKEQRAKCIAKTKE